MACPHLLLSPTSPLIAVPLVASDDAAALRQAVAIRAHDPAPDLVELRADYLAGYGAEQTRRLLGELTGILGDIPILYTHRGAAESGAGDWDAAERRACMEAAVASGQIAWMDVELATEAATRMEIIAAARQHGVQAIISAHDFSGTPDAATLDALFAALVAAGSDAAKLAVTAQTPDDVLRLLAATARAAATTTTPLISMAMGQMGMITRLAGPLYGSSLTFATIGPASAPGQLPLSLVRYFWRHAGIRA